MNTSKSSRSPLKFHNLLRSSSWSVIVAARLGARAVVVGHNFRFGNKAAGNIDTLKRLGPQYRFETHIVDRVAWRGIPVSSSQIRIYIQNGDVSRACRMLGRPFALEGDVVRGQGIGSKKTVPTLNLDTPAEVLPAAGVYITETEESGGARQWRSITNVGYRPTFGADNRLTVETFILDPFEEPAPARIAVHLLKRLRDERKFDSPEALRAQILRDVARAEAYFRRRKRWASYTEVRIPNL